MKRHVFVVLLALCCFAVMAFCAGLQCAYLLPKQQTEIFNIGWGWFIGDILGMLIAGFAIFVLAYPHQGEPSTTHH